MRREVKKLWDAQRPVVEAACEELRARLAHDSYLRERVRGVAVQPARKALYRCAQGCAGPHLLAHLLGMDHARSVHRTSNGKSGGKSGYRRKRRNGPKTCLV